MRFRSLIAGAAVTGALATAACAGSGTLPGAAPAALAPQAIAAKAPTNVFKNPNFATGLSGWTIIKGKSGGTVAASTSVKYTGDKASAYMGSTKPPAVDGLYGIAQTVKVPADGNLTFWYSAETNDLIKYGDQEVDVVVGGKSTNVWKYLVADGTTPTKWALVKVSLKKYAGQTVQIVFGVYDNGYSKSFVEQWLDNVSLT